MSLPDAAASADEAVRAARSKMLPGRVEPPRPHGALHVHRAAEDRRLHVAAQRESDVDDRLNALGPAQVHVLAGDEHVQLAGQVAVEVDAAAELDGPAAHRRRHLVELDAARVEADRAVDVVEGGGRRQVTDAAVRDDRAAREQRLAQRAADRRGQLGAARSAHVAEESLQDAEVGVAGRLKLNALVAQADFAEHAQLGVFADQLEILNLDRPPIERQVNRAVVAQRVVEQPHVERVDGRVDEQVIDVGELAHHANRAARHRGGVRRQVRQEQPDVRIERAVVEPERELGVGLRRQRDAAGAGQREARRRGVHVAAQFVAAQRERAGDLADARARRCDTLAARNLKSLRGASNVPLPVAVNSATPLTRSSAGPHGRQSGPGECRGRSG